MLLHLPCPTSPTKPGWPQVWSMALAATHDAGVLLVHWASLLNACKQL